jgi:hypothetical protein
MKFDSFDLSLRVCWKPFEQRRLVLSDFLMHAKEFREEMQKKIRNHTGGTKTKKKRGKEDWVLGGSDVHLGSEAIRFGCHRKQNGCR